MRCPHRYDQINLCAFNVLPKGDNSAHSINTDTDLHPQLDIGHSDWTHSHIATCQLRGDGLKLPRQSENQENSADNMFSDIES